MAVEFTEQQRKAIDTTDKSILVSAAAGSGKTAVLIERIISIILGGKADVDRMLIVTFTKAAASEMKIKLTRAIKKAISESSDDNKKKLLSQQLDMLYRSYISTFDSFANRIIKEFFYEVDIESNYGIADDVQAQLMQIDALEELLDDCFEDDMLIARRSGSPDAPAGAAAASAVSFRDFMRHYSGDRNENALSEDILKSYNRLRSMPDYFEWALHEAGKLHIGEEGIEYSPVYRMVTESIVGLLTDARNTALDIAAELSYGFPYYAEKAGEDADLIELFIERIAYEGINDELLKDLAGISFARFVKTNKIDSEKWALVKESYKKARESYKEPVKKMRDKYANPSLAEAFKEMSDTYAYTVYFIELLRAFEERYSAKKREACLMDFADINHTAVRILEKESVAGILRDRFEYIFIDEYQDTNYLQEYLINTFARPDNVFKVGDIKQSIYGFRQSEPAIFQETAKRYCSEANCNAMTIDLNRNFRSNGKTINYINRVFETIMDGYDENAMLYKGLPGNQEYDLVPEVHVLIENNMAADDTDPSEYQFEDELIDDLPDDSSEDLTDSGIEIDRRTRIEAEADYVAGIVENIIGTEFYDGKNRVIRKATLRDIVILLRNAKNKASIFHKALREHGINAHITDSDGYFDTVEIGVAISLLSVIDNTKRDVPLIATLHSEVFGFTTEELGEIRAFYREKGGSSAYKEEYNKALMFYLENGADSTLRKKVGEAVRKLEEWQSLSLAMPLDDFVWHVLIDSGYYLYAGSMYGGRQRQANLRVLADYAGRYKLGGVSSLGDFIRYLDILKKNDVKTGQAMMVSEDDDIVRIMTIHKSKGLEFPFVILADMGGKLKRTGMHKGFCFEPKVGVGLQYVDLERHYWRPTIMQTLIHEKKLSDEYEEELRVLYVAMTRAREKLYVVGTLKNEDSISSIAHGRTSYMDIMGEVLRTEDNKLVIRDLEKAAFHGGRTSVDAFFESRREYGDSVSDPMYADVDRRLSYRYQYEEELSTKAKYSVSELRKMALSAMELEYSEDNGYKAFLSVPEFTGKRARTAAEIGTAYHRIMEFVDFRSAIDGDSGELDTDYIDSMADVLFENSALDAEIRNYVDMDKIYDFFRNPVGKRAVDAARKGSISKEKPFTLRMEIGGRNILVQGIVDCCFEEDGKLILIDYKSSYVRGWLPDKEEEKRIAEEYREQIRIYRKALEEGTGKPVSEAYLYLFNTGNVIKM